MADQGSTLGGGTLAMSYGEGLGTVRDPSDLYSEPIEATLALLGVERFPEPIWDPAQGLGHIPAALRQSGYRSVTGTDISSCPENPGRYDFLGMLVRPRAGSIICNPPYRSADQFVLRALALAQGKVAMFLRLQWLEGSGRHRTIFTSRPPHRIWVFRHRVGVQVGGAGKVHRDGMIPYAWMVWDQTIAPSKGPVVGWIGYR